jgi:ABC-type Na+ efflux pump permease subunit
VSKVFAVLRREVRHTVMTKAFLIAVVGVPLLMAGAIAAVVLMTATQTEPPLEGRIAIIETDGSVTDATSLRFAALAGTSPAEEMRRATQEAMAGAESAAEAAAAAMSAGMESGGRSRSLSRGEIRVTVERLEGDAEGEVSEPLRRAVGRGEYLAVALVPAAVLEPPAAFAGDSRDTPEVPGPPDADAEADADADAAPPVRWHLFAGEDVDADHMSLLEDTVGDAIVNVRAARAGVDPAAARALIRRPAPTTDRVGVDGETRRESAMVREFKSDLVPMFFMMLLWISTFSSGTQLLHSTIEEKSNRVMEVLLSAVSPFQLLAGKILGQGLVGLMFVGVYSALGIAGLIALSSLGLISASQLAAFVVYFFMAYFMVAALMAAVGSAVSDLRDANSLLTPVMILLMIPLMLWMPISQSPNGTVATVMSFVPPAIPFVMILRVAAEESVPLWQLGVSIVWGFTCTLGMVWAASRIFRVGVLMTGKPPSPLELIRWIRYA